MMLEVWVISMRVVMGTSGYCGERTVTPIYSEISRSRSSRPCSTSCITSTPVTSLETEAMRYLVRLSTGLVCAASIYPP